MDIFGKNQPNSEGTVSLEELENAFKTPTQRQDYYEQPTAQGDAIPAGLSQPDGPDPVEPVPAALEEPLVSPEKAKRTGERIARLVDTGIDFALSNFVAHNGETYRADPHDLDDIAECWGEIAQEHDWEMSPGWQLAILYVMVYGPLVKQAFTDRRIAELEQRQKDLEARVDAIDRKKNQKPNDHEPATDTTAPGSPFHQTAPEAQPAEGDA